MEKVQILRERIEKFLAEHELQTDVAILSTEEWAARGEPYGNKAVLSMTFEGGLYELLNYPCGRGAFELGDKFRALGEDLGLYMEQGFAWSGHWYPM